jgi:hypothetical protein
MFGGNMAAVKTLASSVPMPQSKHGSRKAIEHCAYNIANNVSNR